MKYLFLFCILQLILATSILSAPTEDEEPVVEDPSGDDKRIVRAKNPDKPYLYYVQLWIVPPGKTDRDGFLCGGTIIDDNWIVTAAHCVTKKMTKGDPKSIRIHHGTINLNKGTKTRPCLIVTHPSYRTSDPYQGNDIALLKLPSKIEGSIHAKLPEDQDENTDYGGMTGLSMGFGKTEIAGFTATLRHAELPIVKQSECYKESQRENKRLICINIAEKAPSVCTGDSGGPLIHKDTLIGVVSYGQSLLNPCEDYNMFTKVAAHLNWIKETMKAKKDEC